MINKTTKRFVSNKRFIIIFGTLFAILVITLFVSFLCGRFSGVSPDNTLKIILHRIFPGIPNTWTATEEAVVMQLRLPRIIAAMMIGTALALSGSAYQALFANPIASPDTLGVSHGASFGAVLGILLNFGNFGMKISAFAIGCIAVSIVYFFASLITRGRNLTIYLLLIGMVVSSMFSAFVSVIKYVADPENQLPQITYWLLGSLNKITLDDIPYYSVFFLMGIIPLLLLSWRMNLLSLSDYEARSIGENTNALRTITILCATLLTAASTAMTGGISWIGLIIPHIARLLVGNDFRKVLPVCALLGSSFLLLMDDLARSISTNEIPISILTSLVGAPVFFVILIKNRRSLTSEN